MANLRTTTMPTGTILSFTSQLNIPDGWLKCDGSILLIAQFPELYAVIGQSFGSPNPGTDFRIPLTNGLFLRGRAEGVALCPDRNIRSSIYSNGATGDNVGSYQDNQTRTPLTGGGDSPGTPFSTNNPGARPVRGSGGTGVHYQVNNVPTGSANGSISRGSATGVVPDFLYAEAHTHTIDGGGGNEVRPRNIYVQYIIKY